MINSIKIEACHIKCDNNIVLNGDLYLPDSKNKIPVIIMRTPYGKHNINAVFDPLQIVRKGFALLVQNVRGRYESNGVFLPFENEKVDGDATIQWLIKQEWCNRHIYALGVSYEGFTSILLGMNQYTKAIAPIMSSSNIYRDWFFENGCIKQGFVQSWSHSFAFTDNGELLSPDVIDEVQKLASDIKKLYYGHMIDFPVNKYLEYYKSWINTEYNDYWKHITKCTAGSNNAAIYYVSGWYDIFCEGTLEQFKFESLHGKNPVKLVVGPWSHTELFGSVVGDVDFGVYSFEHYSSMDIINWFEEIEYGTNAKSSIHIYIMGKNQWYTFNELPVPNYQKFVLLKKNDIRHIGIEEDDRIVDSFDIFEFDSLNPVPTCGGRCIDAIPEGLGGPKKQKNVEERQDVLSYTSDSLDHDITILGKVSISLSCSSTLEKMDYTVKLCDVDELDNSINLLDSCLRVTENANKKKSYELCLGTIGHCFRKGHKIRCDISSSNFPRINIQDWLIDKQGCNTVFLDGITSIQLPIVSIEEYEK